MAEPRLAPARAWARNDVRARWRALVVLGVLAGVTAGCAMAALAGARRTETALERFRAKTGSADAIVFASQVGVPHPDWDALRARPEVADLAVWDLMFGSQDGDPSGLLFVAEDGGFGGRIGRPVVVSGRMWDPNAPDEVVVTAKAAEYAPLGSTSTFQPFGRDQGDAESTPNGPTLTFKVVGVVQTINSFLFTDQVLVGPGFAARYRDQVKLAENVDVRLRNGANDIPALQRDVNDVIAPGTPVLDLHAVSRRVSTTTDVEHAALLLLAIAIAAAGGILVGQALGRSASVIADDALVLRAVGMTRPAIATAVVISHLLAFVVALTVALGTAIAASQLAPVGLSRQIDPDVGVHADWTVLGAGLVLTATALVACTVLVARRTARVDQGQAGRPSGLLAAVRSRAPLTVGIGATMALDGGTGSRRVSVRPALVGASVGVLGVIGALTIQHAVNEALAHPERAGVTWDAQVYPVAAANAATGVDADALDAVAAALPPGSAEATLSRLVVPANGVGVATYSLDDFSRSSAAPITFAVTQGRAPANDGELAVGPKTARDLQVNVGDQVELGEGHVPLRVVGLALFPPDVHAEFDEGLWLTSGALNAQQPPVTDENLFQGAERAIVVRFPEGTDALRAVGALNDRIGGQVQGVSPAEIPAELTNLRNVRTLPVLLAGFLGLLAVAAVSHVLITSSRRRRRDFAVLRAVGVSRRGTRLMLNAQGTAIGLVGLAVGVPLGVAFGRATWRWVADRVPLENVAPFAVLAVVVIIPAAIAVVNALAVWPGHRVSRLRPAEVLRAE